MVGSVVLYSEGNQDDDIVRQYIIIKDKNLAIKLKLKFANDELKLLVK